MVAFVWNKNRNERANRTNDGMQTEKEIERRRKKKPVDWSHLASIIGSNAPFAVIKIQANISFTLYIDDLLFKNIETNEHNIVCAQRKCCSISGTVCAPQFQAKTLSTWIFACIDNFAYHRTKRWQSPRRHTLTLSNYSEQEYILSKTHKKPSKKAKIKKRDKNRSKNVVQWINIRVLFFVFTSFPYVHFSMNFRLICIYIYVCVQCTLSWSQLIECVHQWYKACEYSIISTFGSVLFIAIAYISCNVAKTYVKHDKMRGKKLFMNNSVKQTLLVNLSVWSATVIFQCAEERKE